MRIIAIGFIGGFLISLVSYIAGYLAKQREVQRALKDLPNGGLR